MKVECRSCAYRGQNPGTHHIRCLFDWTGRPMPAGSRHGIVSGWYMFPLNYDPVWMAEECPEWAGAQVPEKLAGPYAPLLELMARLR